VKTIDQLLKNYSLRIFLSSARTHTCRLETLKGTLVGYGEAYGLGISLKHVCVSKHHKLVNFKKLYGESGLLRDNIEEVEADYSDLSKEIARGGYFAATKQGDEIVCGLSSYFQGDTHLHLGKGSTLKQAVDNMLISRPLLNEDVGVSSGVLQYILTQGSSLAQNKKE
jgi:hypothetical protein